MMRTRSLSWILVGLLVWGCGCAGKQLVPGKALDKRTTNLLNMDFVYIPPGSFVMGSPAYQEGRFDDEVRRKVKLTEGFYLQTTEVTQEQWEALMQNNPSHFDKCGSRCPVENVSWNDVQEFIQRLNKREGRGRYRLPTEAEWEYACRLGRKKKLYSRVLDGGIAFLNTLYYSLAESELIPSQDCLSPEKANYNAQFPCAGCPKGECREKTLPVGSLAPDQLGLYDMIGNVYEWCQDNYGAVKCPASFPLPTIADPNGFCKGKFKVYRGGSWMSCFRYCRPAYRGKARPDYEAKNLGFRLVKEL